MRVFLPLCDNENLGAVVMKIMSRCKDRFLLDPISFNSIKSHAGLKQHKGE